MEESCSRKRADASRTWQVGNTRGVPVPGCVSTIPAPPRKHSVPDDVSQEIRLLLGTLKPESVVFEWGSGMSSLYYSQCVTNWTSVEHHLPWCHEMQKHAPPNVRVKCVPIEEEYAASYGSPDTWDGSKQEFKACWELVLGRRGLQLGSGRRRLRSKGAETLDDYGFIACSQLRGGSYVYSRIRPPIDVSAVESRTQKD